MQIISYHLAKIQGRFEAYKPKSYYPRTGENRINATTCDGCNKDILKLANNDKMLNKHQWPTEPLYQNAKFCYHELS